MKACLTLKPGQKGTKWLYNQYGDRLFCVRYRYDEKKKKKFKTVELIVEESDWEPSKSKILGHALAETKLALFNAEIGGHVIVGIRIDYNEKNLQHSIKKVGGIWDGEQKLWLLRYAKVLELGLSERIVKTA